jgi:ABC-2 type transport system ATP-binding protein
MNEAVVQVDGLNKLFGGKPAVEKLSFTVQRGQILGLVGPDAAGKTTTLRILAGVLPADSGTVRVAGQDVIHEPEAVKSRISYMPQHFGLYEDLTVDENIRFYADLFEVPARAREQRSGELLDACGMTPFRRRFAGQLSGGMKRKLGLVCALIHTPEVLLLDEPTTGVDPVSRRELWSILYALVLQGVTVLTSTAYFDEAERCHRLLLLHQGHGLFCGTPAELKSRLPGTVLSIASSEPQRMRAALTGVDGLLSAIAMGDALRVVVDNPERRVPELLARLRSAGLAPGEISAMGATVEDVFVFMVSRHAPERGS